MTAFWLRPPALAVRVNDPTKPLPTVKLNVAEVAPPAIVTEAGVESAALLVVNPIVDADDSAEPRLTVQLPEPPDSTVDGAQASEASEPGIDNAIVTLFEIPFAAADSVPLEFDEKVLAVAVKATDEAPLDATTAVWETLRSGFPLDTPIEPVDPVGTAFDSDTVQAVEPLGDEKPLAQAIEDGATGAVNERAVMATDPLSDAIMVTLRLDVIEPTLTEKLVEVAFCGKTAEAGIVRTLLTEAEMATEAPPAGAALDNVTVQVVLPLDASPAAAHFKDETRGRVPNAIVALPVVPLREAVTVAL
jgi:hypothetical protein